MRTRRILAAMVALSASMSVVGTATPAFAAPAGCVADNKGLVLACDHFVATPGLRGSIGLVGDSVFLGSSPGMSYPSLPLLLNVNGWGPIRMTTSLGMRTNTATSTLDTWKAQGFSPDYVAVNLGANHFGDCTPATVAACKTRIDALLDRIALDLPDAVVWWGKINYEQYGRGTGYSAGMLGWNAALDQAAAQRSGRLVIWDWPTALLTSNPAIATDAFGIHPSSGAEYVKRSTLITYHLNAFMPAHFAGPAVALPATSGAPLDYSPIPPTTLYDTGAVDVDPLAAGVERDIDLSGDPSLPAGAQGLAVTVTASNPTAGGFLRLFPCGETQPTTSNLNFSPGPARSAQALVRLSSTGHLCVLANVGTDVSISAQGAFVPAGSGDTFVPSTPARAIDTRVLPATRAATVTVPVPSADAVSISVTVAGTSAGGTATVYECGQAVPELPNLTFGPSEVIGIAAFVAVSASNTICVQVNTGDTVYADVIVDVTGTFQSSATGLRFQPAGATRLLDTRSAVGGWWGRHVKSQTISVTSAPPGALAVTGTIAMIRPMLTGHIRAYTCGQPLPLTSAVNAPGGLVAANTVTVGINGTQRSICLFASQNTNTTFDVVGWWVATA